MEKYGIAEDSISLYDRWISKKKNDLKSIYIFQRERFNPAHKQNFKKTGWKKYLYSCGGYGGRCGCCKHHEVEDFRNKEKSEMHKKFKDIMNNNFLA